MGVKAVARIYYLGHASFEVKLEGLDGKEKVVLIDPWISNPLSPTSLEDYLRSRENIDYIIVTHDHGDHLGETIDIAKRTGAKVVTIYDLGLVIEEKGVKNVIGANIGGRIKVEDLYIVLTPAYHSSTHGNPVGVVLRGKDVSIYHAGDTGLFAEMTFIGELYKPDIAMLPIGGHFTMGILEAAKAVELIKSKIVIPMHYNTFPPIKADPQEFKNIVEEKTDTKVVILKPGQEYIYP
ncbi:MAG: metal-dependent hydrolase [Desulfurococcales archaeon]|nr:metal-dependent hydrolase [Desulfurococcales archaeon]